jgi:hypothetical protein
MGEVPLRRAKTKLRKEATRLGLDNYGRNLLAPDGRALARDDVLVPYTYQRSGLISRLAVS